jgi:hypothetical protein
MEVFECLLAIAARLEAKMDAQEEIKKAGHEATKAYLEKMEAYLQAMEACLEKVKDKTDADQQEMKACRKEVGACLEKREANPKEVETVVELQEVPNEEVIVEAIRALEDRYETGI